MYARNYRVRAISLVGTEKVVRDADRSERVDTLGDQGFICLERIGSFN